MEEYLKGLNENQYDAATSVDGRIRVVAGAGAGKTKVLTCRYAYLIDKGYVKPQNLLCLTFTNKAANEMRQRIIKMLGDGFGNDFICTIHSFCVKVLRRDIYRLGYPKYFNILDEEDKKALIKEVIEENNLDRKSTNVKDVISDIDKVKSKDISYIDRYLLPNTTQDNESNANRMALNEKLMYCYCKKQVKNFSLDFNDLILFTLYLLTHFEDILSYWQDTLHYIMVDEAQDCNKHDWQILEMLSAKHNNLFIVGDDCQSIYKFRGSDVKQFVHFKNDKTILLNRNYRSTQNILDVANSIIRNNVERVDKDMFTDKSTLVKTIYYHGYSEFAEMAWIVSQIKSMVSNGDKYSDFAVLYRSSNMSRIIEQKLIENQVAYKIYGGIRFYERKEIKDALSYLKLIDSNDDLSFKRVINEPSRKLGKVFVDKVEEYATANKITLYEALKEMVSNGTVKQPTANGFIALIDAAKAKVDELSISDLLQFVLDDSGYMDMLRNDADEDRLDNLQELLNSIKYYEKYNIDNEHNLTTFLQDIALYTNTDEEMDDDVVKLMTIHQSKGLEFKYVFVIGLYEGGLPNFRACRDDEKEGIEEERRLMYVATTRAENKLFLTNDEGYDYMANSFRVPSRFLDEIDTRYIVTVYGKKNRDYFD